MNEVRHQILCAPCSKTVEVNTCSLRESVKQDLHSGLWEALVLGILCWQKAAKAIPETILFPNQKQNVTPSRRRLGTLRKAGKVLCECKSLKIQRKASGILHKGQQCRMHSSGVDRYLFAVALWLCVLGGEWTLLEGCWCSWLWRCSCCLPDGVAAAGKSSRADSLF